MYYKKVAIAVGALACLAMVGVAIAGVTIAAADILNPKMTPEKGTYDEPAGKLGEKSAKPWSQTTVAAAVDQKPLPGKVVTIVGEIIDLSCYTSLGKHGTKHRDCGQKCLKNGQPIGLLDKDGKVYLLMEEEHDQRRDGLTKSFREAAIENMAYVMEVSGTLSVVEGMKTLHVQGFVKK